MRSLWIVTKRELVSYFSSPIAYVFIVIFLLLSTLLTFKFGGFFINNEASLRVFFENHTWLYLILVPAIGMQLWAEERRQGTIELLFTLPISRTASLLGKFLAAWIFVGVALPLIFTIGLPLEVTKNVRIVYDFIEQLPKDSKVLFSFITYY